MVPVPLKDVRDALLSSEPPSTRQKRALRVWASLPVYLAGIWILHCVRDPRPIEKTPPTFLRLVGELVFGIFAYDFIFYWLHLLMHVFPHSLHGHHLHHELSVTKHDDSKINFLEAE